MRELSLDSAPGADIAQLKRDLRAAGFGPQALDDMPPGDPRWRMFTAAQDEAVRKLQRYATARGIWLAVDGIYGEQTHKYLAALLEPSLRQAVTAGKNPPPVIPAQQVPPGAARPPAGPPALEKQIIAEALACVGIREHGHNRGAEVEAIIAEGGGKPGDAWCAWFCVAMRRRACIKLGLPVPAFAIRGNVDALVRDARHAGRLESAPGPGRLLVLGKGGDYTHVGIIERVAGSTVYTVEGNTNGQGGSEGDGVYRKKRQWKSGYAVVRVT